MTRWPVGERTVTFLIERGRLEMLGDTDLSAAAETAMVKSHSVVYEASVCDCHLVNLALI